MTAPTAEAFLSEPSTDEDDFEHEEAQPRIDLGYASSLVSIAESLHSIASTIRSPLATRDAEATDAHTEELRELGQAYDDLEAKYQSLYELLADVEKIVAKSKSQVSLEVKAAINEWRNPTVDAVVQPGTGSEDASPASVPVENAAEMGAQPPAADASIDDWRTFARACGVEGAHAMNRSQIRTALGLPHFEG